MRSLFPNTYDRADLLMSAGCSTFVSAALVLLMPKVGIVLVEILVGLFLVGCALAARARLRRRTRIQAGSGIEAKTKRLDRYDALMIVAVIVIQSSIAGVLRRAGWSEGGIRIVPLILLGTAILVKPRLTQFLERRKDNRRVCSKNSDSIFVATAPGDMVAQLRDKGDE